MSFHFYELLQLNRVVPKPIPRLGCKTYPRARAGKTSFGAITVKLRDILMSVASSCILNFVSRDVRHGGVILLLLCRVLLDRLPYLRRCCSLPRPYRPFRRWIKWITLLASLILSIESHLLKLRLNTPCKLPLWSQVLQPRLSYHNPLRFLSICCILANPLVSHWNPMICLQCILVHTRWWDSCASTT